MNLCGIIKCEIKAGGRYRMQRIASSLRSIGMYFWFSVFLFIVAVGFGYTSDAFRAFLDQQLAELGELAEQIGGMENAHLMLFVVIFLNNTIKSIFVLYAGLFLGLFPLFFITVNGMLIGYLIRQLNENVLMSPLPVWEVIVKGLLPHGIIEIPVVLVAAAYGLKLGWTVWQKLLFWSAERKRSSLKQLLVESGPVVLFITIALFVAALIEAFITPVLLMM